MKSLSLLLKPAANKCNMRCLYCFSVDRDDEDAAVPTVLMAPATLETAVQKALAHPEESCTFGFQGGEPTLAGLDFFRKFIELEKRHNTRGIPVAHAIETNGLLIDDEWADFFAENAFLVGVSLDAGKQIHDQMRPDTHGRDTHNRVVEATRILRKHEVDFTILSVVTRALARHPDRAYRYLKERDFRHVQFIPCLDPIGETPGQRLYSLDSASYEKFLCRVFDLWYAEFAAGDYYSIRMFDNFVHMLAGFEPEQCSLAGVCQAYLLVEANGDVYPCDYYQTDEFRLGNINDDSVGDLLEGERARAFVDGSRRVPDACGACEFFSLCRGGCRRNRETGTDGLPERNLYCEAYQAFFEHAMPRLKQLADGL